MADFKTHINWGAVLAVVFSVTGAIFSFFSGLENIFWVFLTVLIGSFLPDLDCDEGVPFQMIFGIGGLLLAGSGFYYFFQNGEKDLKFLIGIPVLLFILVRFVFGYFFQKITEHRGIFHSIPAAALFGLLTVWILENFLNKFQEKWWVGAGIIIGYLGHLILDEVYSTINLKGLSILPKKSLGSALKFWSSSIIITSSVYFLVGVLLFNLKIWTKF